MSSQRSTKLLPGEGLKFGRLKVLVLMGSRSLLSRSVDDQIPSVLLWLSPDTSVMWRISLGSCRVLARFLRSEGPYSLSELDEYCLLSLELLCTSMNKSFPIRLLSSTSSKSVND